MILNQIKIDYPKTLPDVLQKTLAEFEAEAKMAMAVKLFEMKRISSDMAARMAGMDRVSFLMSLHHFGVPVIDLEEEELLSDIQNIRKSLFLLKFVRKSVPAADKDLLFRSLIRLFSYRNRNHPQQFQLFLQILWAGANNRLFSLLLIKRFRQSVLMKNQAGVLRD